jgi:predicted RNase H-like nuclease (RuvC/YqgF family)
MKSSHEVITGWGILQAQVEEQKHQVTTVDVENLQLIDRLHTMSSEIAYLKTTLNEKQKQEDQLHRALEDSTMLESSMRGEIEQQHLHTEELELEVQNLQVLCLTLVTGILALSFHLCLLSISFAVRNLSLPILKVQEADQNFKHKLQKKLQVKNVEDTAGEVRYNLEIQNLEHAVKELRIKLAEKASQIDSYDKVILLTRSPVLLFSFFATNFVGIVIYMLLMQSSNAWACQFLWFVFLVLHYVHCGS